MTDYNRFSDALGIWSGGACNISGIARSLVKAADAARADGVQPCEDLAVRAIVAQLAWLCKVDAIGGVGGVVDIESKLKGLASGSLIFREKEQGGV